MNDSTKYSNSDKDMMLKLFDLVESVNETLAKVNDEVTSLKVNMGKNNVVLKQHHSRSTHLEGIVETVQSALAELTRKITSINTNVKNVDNDLKPIKEHVKKVDKYITIASGIPLFFKLIFWGFIFVSSAYGCYNVIVKWLN